MRKLMIVVAVLAMCGVAMAQPNIAANTNTTVTGAPATATVDVALSVAKYAEVNFNAEGMTGEIANPALEMLGPVGWVQGKNWLEFPIEIRSNCDVRLQLQEGLTDALDGAGVPRAGLWKSTEYVDTPLYGTLLVLSGSDRTQYQTLPSAFGREIIGSVAGRPGDTDYQALTDLPLIDGLGGSGLTGYTTFRMGEAILDCYGQSHGWGNYEGEYAAFVAVGANTIENEIEGWNWTQLQPQSLGTINFYATVMVDGI